MRASESAPEDDLVRRFREGDGDALCRLFERHERVLRAQIARLLPRDVRRRVSISDVLQESRIAALERCRDFEPRGGGDFRNWALGIARNKALRAVQRHGQVAMRSVRREVTRPARAETGQFHGQAPTPSQLAIAAELAELARRAMASLRPDDREILRLTREEQLTLREAAERMGRSREAAKKLYGRALTRFADALNELRGPGDA